MPLAPLAILSAAHTLAQRVTAARDTTVTGVELGPQMIRLEGVVAGKRLVIEAVFAADANGVAVQLGRAVGRSSVKRSTGVAADHTAAVLAALA